MRGAWTYIMTSRPRGVLYIGVTANLPARVWQNRNGEGSDFCRRYKLTRLVLVEQHGSIEQANSKWLDLWEVMNA